MIDRVLFYVVLGAAVALLCLAYTNSKPLLNPCANRYAPPPPACPIHTSTPKETP